MDANKHLSDMENYWRDFKVDDCWTNASGVLKRKDFIVNNIGLANSRVLDIGCGSGLYTQLLAPHAFSIIGIDIANRTEIEGTAPDNIDLALMSAENLGFQEDVFDLVIMIEVLEHIPHDEIALKEAHRVLKPGGKLVISVPNKFFPFETHTIRIGAKTVKKDGFPLIPFFPARLRKHFETARVYTVNELSKKLTQHGFLIRNIAFLMPALDGLQRGVMSGTPRLLRLLRQLPESFERSPIKFFGMSILVIAQKDTTSRDKHDG